MLTESEIIGEIEATVKHYPNYPRWTIGITSDPARRKEQLNNPSLWYQWNATLASSAQNIEKYFLDKGMKLASGLGGIYATYVYMFM